MRMIRPSLFDNVIYRLFQSDFRPGGMEKVKCKHDIIILLVFLSLFRRGDRIKNKIKKIEKNNF